MRWNESGGAVLWKFAAGDAVDASAAVTGGLVVAATAPIVPHRATYSSGGSAQRSSVYLPSALQRSMVY